MEPRCQHISPSDVTSRAIRPLDAPCPEKLYGTEGIFKVFYDLLVESRRHPHSADVAYQRLIPPPQTIMLYGRKGSGKNTMLHSNGRVLFSQFGRVCDWKMRPWNMAGFLTWCESRVNELVLMSRTPEEQSHYGNVRKEAEPRGPDSLLILIENIHQFNYARAGEVVDAFVRLLTVVRCCHTRRNDIRVVLTCDESPGQFPGVLMELIDTKFLMQLPGPMDNVLIALSIMKEFRLLMGNYPDTLGRITWSIDLDEQQVMDDPNHPLSLFAVRSIGTTPREIRSFLERSFAMCSKPVENGGTEYGPYLLESLVYDIEGTACITPYNPLTKNNTIYKYARVNREMGSQGIGTCVVSSNEVILNDVDREILDKEKEKETKRAKIPQPRSISEALAARIKAQEESLDKAAKVAERKRPRPE